MAVDKTFECHRRVMYFEYKGVRFKFIQQADARKWSDHLVTVIAGDYHSAEGKTAYAVAGEWASALAWETHRKVSLRLSGALGWRQQLKLRNARGNVRVFPELPFHGRMLGYDFSRIARIDNDRQRTALALFREARNSNNVMLSILLYWQVMEVGSQHAAQWISKAARRHGSHIWRSTDYVARLPVGARQLGDYLQDDFRHAIAHIRRKPGRTAIRFDNLDDEERLGLGVSVLEDLARFYIETELKLTETLLLVRPRTRGFPRYLSSEEREAGWFRLAYEPHHWAQQTQIKKTRSVRRRRPE
jgi:hypothetical protein